MHTNTHTEARGRERGGEGKRREERDEGRKKDMEGGNGEERQVGERWGRGEREQGRGRN